MQNSNIVTDNQVSEFDPSKLPAEQLNNSCFCSSLDKCSDLRLKRAGPAFQPILSQE